MRRQYALFAAAANIALAVLACSLPTAAVTPTESLVEPTVAPSLTSPPPVLTLPPPSPTSPPSPPSPTPPEVKMPFVLTSTAFTQGKPIPAVYTCTSRDISLPLAWGDPPEGTQSLALIMDDPDAPAGTWVHWVIYNIPATARGLPENIPPDATLADGSLQGKNSWGRLGYGGPCPPSGTHRYFFKLYALDTMLNLPSGASKQQLLQAMGGHILAQIELMGTYKK